MVCEASRLSGSVQHGERMSRLCNVSTSCWRDAAGGPTKWARTWVVFVLPVFSVLGACDNRVGVERLDDGGFVDTGASDSAGLSDVTPGIGCSLTDLETCTVDVCCDVPAERCVPGVFGENQCLPTGDRLAGQRCGQQGPDDCSSGLLCAGDPDSEQLICRTICASSADCAEGSTCTATLLTVLDEVQVCDPF